MMFRLIALALLTQSTADLPDCSEEDLGILTFTHSFPACGCSVICFETPCSVNEGHFHGPIGMVRINCDRRDANYSAISGSELSAASTFKMTSLNALHLEGCKLPNKLADLLHRLGRTDETLFEIHLESVHGHLRREHVIGLRALRTLSMANAADQILIPFDVFDALPTLEEFNLRKAPLQLMSEDDNASPHPALRSLQLESCGITDVPPDAFTRLGNLIKLDLGWNHIKSFTREAFRGLDKLESLSLLGNPITTLPSQAFSFVLRLRTFSGNFMSLSVVPANAFDGLQRLEEVTIRYGNKSLEFGAGAIGNLSALKILSIESTALKPVPADLIHGSEAIERLTIRDASLETIPKGFFISQRRLKRLDLSRNRIKVLDADVFQPIKVLYELNLDENALEEFPNYLFSGLLELKSISANKNRLKRIPSNAFDTLRTMHSLSLNDNLLTSETCPQKLPTLDTLSLQGNQLTYVIPRWQLLYHLKKLDLSRNNFTFIKETDIMFKVSPNLEIDLRHNHITTVKMNSFTPNQSKYVVRSNYVTRVLLDGNPFKCDCELYDFIKALDGSNHHFILSLKLDPELAQCASPPALIGKHIRNLPLTSLSCTVPAQDCPAMCICSIHPATHSLDLDCVSEPSAYPKPGLYEQKTIHLRLRRIQSLKLPSYVVSLNLSGLNLTEAPPLDALRNIQELDLSQNNLAHAPIELFHENITLRLTENPFDCDCSNLDTVYALLNSGSVIDADNITCSGGQSLMRVEKLCEVRKASILGGTLGALGILVAVVVGLTNRFSLEIKVFFFSRGWFLSWIREDDLEIAEYDAFVSFSQEDAQWVQEQLLPKLEGEPNNFRLCVHYRDWVVGDMIPAQIATSVERSRRTIFVLTENFLKSTWALLEFRAANARAQRERRARILIVVLGEVPECEEMDAELRAYLTTNTYLKWGDPWFWEKLKYAMPHRR